MKSLLLFTLLLVCGVQCDVLQQYDGETLGAPLSHKSTENYLKQLLRNEQGFSLMLVDMSGKVEGDHRVAWFSELVASFHGDVPAFRLFVEGTRPVSKEFIGWWIRTTQTYQKNGIRYDAKFLGGSVVVLIQGGELLGGVFWEAPSDITCVVALLKSRLGDTNTALSKCQVTPIHDKDFDPLFIQKVEETSEDQAGGHEDL